MFDKDYPEGTYYLYIAPVHSSEGDYRDIKDSFKIGYSRNVEKHLVTHLEPQWDIDWRRAIKVPMPSRSEAVALKKLITNLIKFDKSCFYTKFNGVTDWYEMTSVPGVLAAIKQHNLTTL